MEHHHALGLGAVLEPAVEIPGPVLRECGLVVDDDGVALDRDEDPRSAIRRAAALQRQPHLGVALDIVHHQAVFPGEIIAVAVVIDLAVVAHRPRADLPVVRVGVEHDEIDVLHRLGDVGEMLLLGLVGHGALLGRGSKLSARRGRGFRKGINCKPPLDSPTVSH